jgi:OmpA-OmpF porin, OOP family
MKKVVVYFSFLFLSFLQQYTFAQNIITEEPYIEEANTQEAKINKIELTDKYTIIYMSFELGNDTYLGQKKGKLNKNGRTLQDLLDILMGGSMGRASSKAFIAIRPSSSLIALNGDRTFRYIKASGIPEEPNQLDVYAGEKVNFKVYYERIDPGINVFDFFEGYNSDQVRCWNYYKVHITNPAPKTIQKSPETELPIIANNLFFIKGKVLDSKTKKPVNARLEYLLSPKLEAVDSTMTYWNSGAYKITLPQKGIYNCVVSAPGYLVSQETIEITENNAGGTLIKDIYLTPFEKGDVIRLNNVYFETSQFYLLTASYSELNKLVKLMADNPSMRILLEGHTDIVGDKQANIELSQNRVNSVKKYLVENGIDASRIETKGWGSAKPVNANGTDAERSLNRRVEFRVLSI